MTTEKIIGTKEAFLKMISERGVYKKLGVDRCTVAAWKRSIDGRDARGLSLDKMEEMLIKGGWKVFQEKIWDI